jgi:hypothetical protein
MARLEEAAFARRGRHFVVVKGFRAHQAHVLSAARENGKGKMPDGQRFCAIWILIDFCRCAPKKYGRKLSHLNLCH